MKVPNSYVFVLAAMLAVFAGTASAGPCERLASLSAANTRVTAASTVAAGGFSPPAQLGSTIGGGPSGASIQFNHLPAFCRVTATLTPTSDSDIKIEVWMPVSDWNGKLQSVGNGGWAGLISYPALAVALSGGYATASTDTGHTGNTGSFALGHPEKYIDFGYRAVHEMTIAAKAIIAAYYGKAPKFSYWNGCSSGGRQGLTEAQRYPSDYDAIIAGAPGGQPSPSSRLVVVDRSSRPQR